MRPFDKIEFIASLNCPEAFAVTPSTQEEDIEALACLLDWGGWPSPVILDDNGKVIAGVERIAAIRRFGEFYFVPAVRARNLTAEDRAMFAAADARLGAKIAGGAKLLGLEEAPIRQQASPESPPTVTRHGDVWMVGRHRLACGDARQIETLHAALQPRLADVVFVDPPQNLFGQLQREPYVKGLVKLMVMAKTALRDGGLMFVSLDYRNVHTWLMITGNVDLSHIDIGTWLGARGVMGGLYPCGHKLVCIFRKSGPHINNLALDSERTNAWLHAGVPEHPTTLPPELIAEIVEDTTPASGRVLQTCAGSGFCLDAAERTGRTSAIVELSTVRCDAMLRRWQSEFGCEALLQATGEPFSERVTQASKR